MALGDRDGVRESSARASAKLPKNKKATKALARTKTVPARRTTVRPTSPVQSRPTPARGSSTKVDPEYAKTLAQVQKYEKGVNRVGAARLQQIASALDVPVTFFYDGDNKAREVESLLFLDSAFSLRLLRAYSKIKDQTVQRQLV